MFSFTIIIRALLVLFKHLTPNKRDAVTAMLYELSYPTLKGVEFLELAEKVRAKEEADGEEDEDDTYYRHTDRSRAVDSLLVKLSSHIRCDLKRELEREQLIKSCKHNRNIGKVSWYTCQKQHINDNDEMVFCSEFVIRNPNKAKR